MLNSILKRFTGPYAPYFLLISILMIAGLGMLIQENMPAVPYQNDDHSGPWIVLMAFILFFAISNNLMSFMPNVTPLYWTHSIISFAILLVLGGLMAYGISGRSMDDAGSFRWLYGVFTFSYLVLMSISIFIKFIIFMIQKNDQKITR